MKTPDVPEEVTAELVTDNTVDVRWVPATRAAHYRVWAKIKGVDEEAKAVGSPTDPDFMIEGLPPNSTIEIAISAVNSAGESRCSQVVTIAT